MESRFGLRDLVWVPRGVTSGEWIGRVEEKRLVTGVVVDDNSFLFSWPDDWKVVYSGEFWLYTLSYGQLDGEPFGIVTLPEIALRSFSEFLLDRIEFVDNQIRSTEEDLEADREYVRNLSERTRKFEDWLKVNQEKRATYTQLLRGTSKREKP